MSAGFAIVVTFAVKPQARAQFMALARDNAQQSIALEGDCLRFDILEPDDRPDEIWLYEVYTDRAAFDAHLQAAHFQTFDAATRDMIAAKTVVVARLEENAKP